MDIEEFRDLGIGKPEPQNLRASEVSKNQMTDDRGQIKTVEIVKLHSLFRAFVLSPVLSLPKGAFVMIFSFFGIQGLRN